LLLQKQPSSTNKRPASKSSVFKEKSPIYPFNPEEIIQRYPSQNTFEMPGGITISSEFDSGNLGKCFVDETNPKSYICWLAGDGQPYE
jgi:hypothetical protein